MADECKRLEDRADRLQQMNVALLRTVNKLKIIEQYLDNVDKEAKHSKICLHDTCSRILSDPEFFIDQTNDGDHKEVSPVDHCPVKLANVVASDDLNGHILPNANCSRCVSREDKNLGRYTNEHLDTADHVVKDEVQLLMTDVKSLDPYQQDFTSLCHPPNEQGNNIVKEIEEYLKTETQCLAYTKEIFENTSQDDNSQPAFSESEAVGFVADHTWKPYTVIRSIQDAHSPDSGYDSEDRSNSPSLLSPPPVNQNEAQAEAPETSANNNLDGGFNAEIVKAKPFIEEAATHHSVMAKLKAETQYPSFTSLSCKDDPSLHLNVNRGNLLYSKNEDIKARIMHLQLCGLREQNLSRMINDTDNMVVFGELGRSSDLDFDSDGCSDISSSPPDWMMNRGNSKVQQVVLERDTFSKTTYILIAGNSSDIYCDSKSRIEQIQSIPIPEKKYGKRTSIGSMRPTHENRNKVKRRECFKRCTVSGAGLERVNDLHQKTGGQSRNDSNIREEISDVGEKLENLSLK